ncbi:hypothetical protein K492DRAFT_121822 [Lichtheimia hyalospora FSU 10163]|nr:hypothetical protein K492DRAFT_121822 [Lichtheimia hyalospora FSU 10163]
MAAVSFLETTNLVGLGLSADKVLSHVTDLNSSKEMSGPGLKLMSDMVDSSYKMFDGLGRLWQRDAGKPQSKGEGPMQKFLDKKSVEDLKIGEVAELLADYKRLAAMMKQAGLC